jgi:FHA domain
MNVTECIPLAGRGLVARRGSLVALSDGMDAGPDPLLTALTAVADANGDGTALVLAGTRAALEHGGRPAWACAGVTLGGDLVVLAHGEAAALVSVDGSPEVEVTATGSMIPVARTFTGAIVTVRLVIGAAAAPDPRLWLDAGTVFGGGILLTVTQEKSHSPRPNDPYAPALPTTRPAVEQAAENPVLHPSVPPPAGPAPAGPVPIPVLVAPVPAAPVPVPVPVAPAIPVAPDVAPGEVYPEDGLPEPEFSEPAFSEPAFPEPVLPAAALLEEVAYPPGYEPTMLAGIPARQAGGPAGGPAAFQEPAAAELIPFPDDPFANPAGPAGRIQPGPKAETWFRSDAPPSGPTMRMTQTDGAGNDGLSDPPIADISTMKLVQLGVVEPVVVDGSMCARMHFNAPDQVYCRECGISMRDAAKNLRRQPRPPLGVLLVDDGRGYTLDRDYVIGREPLLDDDVAAGRATPLPITDPESSVSRLHLRVSLVGWRVEVRDLGSANGSVLYRAGGPRTLAPVDSAVLDPGARVGVGRRSVQFLPYGASPHSASPHSATPDGVNS